MAEQEKKPKATPELAERLDFINKAFQSNESESGFFELYKEYEDLRANYDWFDEVFEENGKKGLRNVKGEVVVPAMYDDFGMIPSLFFPHDVPAQKDGKMALVKRDGNGTPICEFEYHYIEPMFMVPLYIAYKPDDLKHFALMAVGVVITPFELVDYGMCCDDHIILGGDNDKYGIINVSSLLYIAPEYDAVINNGAGEDFTFVKDGKEGRVTLDKRFISDEEFASLSEDEQDDLTDEGFICAPDDF